MQNVGIKAISLKLSNGYYSLGVKGRHIPSTASKASNNIRIYKTNFAKCRK